MCQKIALLLFSCLLVSFDGLTKVTIRGKIVGYDGKSLVYYHPTIEGIYTSYWEEIKPSNNGSFKIEFENEGFGNTTISYKNLHYRFFHDGNSQIYFEFNGESGKQTRGLRGNEIFSYYDSIKQKSTLKIEGDYEAVNKFYNRNMRSSYFTTRMVDGNHYSHMVYKTGTPSQALALLDSLMQLEIDQINKLPRTIDAENPDQEKKDEEIRSYLTNEVHAFYGAILLNAMFLKRKEHIYALINDSTSAPDLYNREWEVLIERLYEHTKNNIAPIPSNPDYMDFIESMTYTLPDYKRYEFPQNPSVSLDEIVVNRIFNYDSVLIPEGKTRLAYKLNELQLFLNDHLFYSPILLSAVYELQDQYPESANLQHYQPLIEKLKKSLEVSRLDFENARIIDANYNSFSSLIKRFDGKNVFVDVWATWCHPCIEEFKYTEAIKPFVEKGQIEILYISIDKKQWDDRWRQSIKINELAGTHFRANPKFIEDMWTTIGDYVGVIPRYVLIDKHGKIFRSTAARPSAGTELIEQIKSMVK